MVDFAIPGNWVHNRIFRAVHERHLVYNACWEDPRLDQTAMQLSSRDRVLVITSAGCNVLDYVLSGPQEVHAVDVNPRQNALLELKLAGIRGLDFDDFFEIFGRGRHPAMQLLYPQRLRNHLSPDARTYWDRHWRLFSGEGARGSFYFRGSCGLLAWMANLYIDRVARVRPQISAALNAGSLEEQRDIYDRFLHDAFWGRFIRWTIGRDATLALLGVPRPQRRQIDRQYPGRISQFIQDSVAGVFRDLPLRDNYFWRVYLTGEYTRDCCPEYLREENFLRLKSGLVDRVHVQTSTMLEFLRSESVPITRFVLLDHMDWLCDTAFPQLVEEWQAILDAAAPGARVLWRSGGLQTDYLDKVYVRSGCEQVRLTELLSFHTSLAAQLHPRDRVHTYGSFYIAELPQHLNPFPASRMEPCHVGISG